MSIFNQIVSTLGGRDVTTTGDYKVMAAVPAAARSLASTLLNLVPLDVLIPLAISAALKVATSGTGNRSKQIKKILIQVAKGVSDQFPGEVCS